MNKLLRSKAFWTALVDVVVKMTLIILQQLNPEAIPLADEIWLALQPLVLIIIAAFTADDLEQRIVVTTETRRMQRRATVTTETQKMQRKTK